MCKCDLLHPRAPVDNLSLQASRSKGPQAVAYTLPLLRKFGCNFRWAGPSFVGGRGAVLLRSVGGKLGDTAKHARCNTARGRDLLFRKPLLKTHLFKLVPDDLPSAAWRIPEVALCFLHFTCQIRATQVQCRSSCKLALMHDLPIIMIGWWTRPAIPLFAYPRAVQNTCSEQPFFQMIPVSLAHSSLAKSQLLVAPRLLNAWAQRLARLSESASCAVSGPCLGICCLQDGWLPRAFVNYYAGAPGSQPKALSHAMLCCWIPVRFARQARKYDGAADSLCTQFEAHAGIKLPYNFKTRRPM